ncbi:hypothetical protein O181_080294 [Austropuccinia psidii MF-1]|uniref:Uncharacterized protein n=1 Tax=Austropuccinia psidii MF-1 TaxID=1389203 RepID=A0A9Q3IJ19_9BASI|nr:hypothetical protein [Austropuccinia psidii MF-1]
MDNTPVGSPLPILLPQLRLLPLMFTRPPQRTPVQSPSHSNNDPPQEFTDLRPTLMIPRAIVSKSINRIMLEHCRLLHMIPFVEATH